MHEDGVHELVERNKADEREQIGGRGHSVR